MRLVAKEKMKPRQKKNPLREAHLRGFLVKATIREAEAVALRV